MISVVIPHYPAVPGAPESLKRCVASMKGQYDELLVIVNDGIGYAKAVNIGLEAASGDFLIVANNDTFLVGGNLRFLCDDASVTVPLVNPVPRDDYPRSFFCLPRWVYDKVGGFDERFEGGYFEDDDFLHRLYDSNVYVARDDRVVVQHQDGGGMTMKFIGEQEHFDKNKAVYEEKWGRTESRFYPILVTYRTERPMLFPPTYEQQS